MQEEREKEKPGNIQQAVEVKNSSKSSSKYPYVPVTFLMVATSGQEGVAAGILAILELYFVRFLFICLGMDAATSMGTTCVNIFIATFQLCAISAGLLADKVLGNYLTQVFSVFLKIAGMFLLAFATWQYSITELQCCYETGNNASLAAAVDGAVAWSNNCSELYKKIILPGVTFHLSPSVLIALAILGLMLFAVGYGHITTLQCVFIADQFREDQSEAMAHSFGWYFLFTNVGALATDIGLPIVRQSLGFVIAWFMMLGVAVVFNLIFLCGSCFYVKKKPQRPQCCCTKRSFKDKTETEPLLEEKSETKHSSNSWLRELLPFVGVFTPFIVMWGILYQQLTTFVVQATHMNCYLGKLHIPPDIMPSVCDALVIVIVVFLDYLVYPHLEKSMKIKIKQLHKLIAGMVFGALSFLMAGLLQIYVNSYQFDDCHGNVSIAWQVPQLILMSFAEVIVAVTGMEFAYSQAPPRFRNIVIAMASTSQALGTLLNVGAAQIRWNLMEEFFTYTGLMLVTTVLFAIINKRFLR